MSCTSPGCRPPVACLRSSWSAPKGRRASAGIISTFGDEHHAAAKTYDFDISAQLGLIGAGDKIGVELVPTTGVEDAKGARVAQPTGRISFSQMTITRN